MVVDTGGGGGTGTTAAATPSQGGSGSNLLTTFLDGWKAAIDNAPTALAQAVGLWFAAKAAIQTVAAGVAGAVSQATINTANAKYMGMPLSPSVLATGTVRGVWPDSSGGTGTLPSGYPAAEYPNGVAGNTITEEAALSGLNGNRFAGMVAATGM